MKERTVILLMVVLLIGGGLYIRENSHSRGCGKVKVVQYHNTFINEYVLEIPTSGYEAYFPENLYFGADLSNEFIAEWIQKNAEKAEVKADEDLGYFIMEGEARPVIFSVHFLNEPFVTERLLDRRMFNSFLIYNGKADLYSDDFDSYIGSILFPDIVIPDSAEKILETGGISLNLNDKYEIRDKEYSCEWFQEYYESTGVYDVKRFDNRLELEIKDDVMQSIQKNEETVFSGKWQISFESNCFSIEMIK